MKALPNYHIPPAGRDGREFSALATANWPSGMPCQKTMAAGVFLC